MTSAVPAAPVNDAGTLAAVSPSHYRVDGALRFATVAALRQRGLASLRAAPAGEVIFDLQNVSADSAGLALLVDWLACARRLGRPLRYANPPAALLALARLSDVEPLLKGG